MKELSIEEKAKRYDEAIELAQRFYNNCVAITKEGLEYIFPELKESEDERIRKTLVAVVNLYYGEGEDEEKTACLYWLEKQGEYNKFRDSIQVGDKVTRNEEGVLVNLSQLNRVDKKQGEQKPEWSEEDEKMLEQCCVAITDSYFNKIAKGQILIDWLKSLSPQKQWKPSEEQMEALDHYVNDFIDKTSDYAGILKELLEQLKAL